MSTNMNEMFLSRKNKTFMAPLATSEQSVRMKGIGERLRLAAQRLGIADAEVARRLGIGPERYGNYVRDKREPDFETLRAICATLQVTPDWLFGLSNDAPAPRKMPARCSNDAIEYGDEAYIPVGVYGAEVSAGPGCLREENPEPQSYSFFRQSWLRHVTGAATKDLAVLRVSGDSMWETLHHGDHVLVDMTVRRIQKDSLYVIHRPGDDELQVKRLQIDWKTGLITVISDNPRYNPITDVPEDRIAIIGRVIWLGRHLG